MAAATAVQLSGVLQEQRAIIERNADNPAALTEAFIAVAKCMEDYFFVSDGEVQSPEINESMAKFGWSWVELPQFPLRQLLPFAAKALQRFPENKALVIVIADWCNDVCKQNMLAKTEAMQCGMLQGLCLAAGHLWQNMTYEEEDYLLAGRIFRALRLAAEPPGVKFYLQPEEVKDEFYSTARKAWQDVRLESVWEALEERAEVEQFGPVNPALLLTAYYLKYFPDADNMEQYLEVLKSLGEAFGFTWPGVAANTTFQRFLKDTLLEAKQFGACPELFDEVLLLHKRTLNVSRVPYNHKKPFLLPALNRQFLAQSNAFKNRPRSAAITEHCQVRRNDRRMASNVAESFASFAAIAADILPSSTSAGTAAQDEAAGDGGAGEASTSRQGRRAKTRTCANCSKEQKQRAPGEPAFQKCSRCNSAHYCGRECQKIHWKDHKLVCLPP
ncbi:hypothetical protein KFL_000690170 [Klebsormidium nitens]|uniref:MYND-type domain-containing protein n=1 Tax=Klebsormidium nitens TaxID=105231 RepID=A0A1Y1HWX7_KLENI|nr:hypothetical protein KFL_000690170 [Klebsormidium nitens]|eukprot:GAQ81037.1 hypothetical protein KFL_000690170 [Klebsormidium nitens]